MSLQLKQDATILQYKYGPADFSLTDFADNRQNFHWDFNLFNGLVSLWKDFPIKSIDYPLKGGFLQMMPLISII